mgnify:CR=1 FL=1
MEYIGLSIAFFLLYGSKGTDPKIDKIKEKLARMNPSLAKLDIFPSNETYTRNKRTIHLCLRDKNGEYYDENTLIYVALLEIVHILTRGERDDHDEKFLSNFDFLITRAIRHRIYDPSKPLPHDYCGVKNVKK